MATTHNAMRPPSAPDTVDYRPVSTAAVVGLLLGLASGLAFVHPVLWVLPVAAAVLNLVALWHIGRHVPALVGRRAAEIGLALSIALGIAAPTQYYVLTARSRYEAQLLAQMWLDALRADDLEQAVGFMQNMTVARLTGTEQETEDADVPKVLRRPGPLPVVEMVRTIRAMGRTAEIRLLSSDELEVTTSKESCSSRWEVSGEVAGKPTSMQLQISLARSRRAPRRVREWHVVNVLTVDESPVAIPR